MAQGQRKYGLTDFMKGYFDSIGKMTLANLLYCIPLAVFLGIIMLMFKLTGEMNLFGLFLIVPLMSPFTSVNGVIVYIVSLGLYITFAYFRENLDKPIVIFYLIMSLIAGLFFMFVELSLVTMAVTVDLKMSEMLKNAVMLVTGGISGNNHADVQINGRNEFIRAVFDSAFDVAFYHICIYNSYQTIEKAVIKPYAEEKRKSDIKKELAENEKAITIEELEMLSKGDKNEYVSLKGRMVKRSTVIKMLETKKNMQNNIDDI